MGLQKAGAIYSVIIGILMIGMWATFYMTDSIPELMTKPAEIRFHMTAEIVTAAMLIIGGLGVVTSRKWGFPIYLLSTGMLFYTCIQSPGYYVQRAEVAFVGMFAVVIALAVIFLTLSFYRKDDVTDKE